MRNVPLSLWTSYLRSLQARPLATKSAAAATIFFASDLVTQHLTRDDDDGGDREAKGADIRRAISGASFGVIGTVYLHHWWNFLERFVEARFPAGRRRMANAAAKVVIDQTISAPFYYYSYYVITNYIRPNLSGSGSESGNENEGDAETTTAAAAVDRLSHWERLSFAFGRASDMVWPTMLRHWRVWPPIHFVNFYYTPLQHRVLVQNLVLVVWSGYLSHLNHGRQNLAEDEEVMGGTTTEEGDKTERRTAKLKRRKTVITGLDVVEEEEEKRVRV